MGLKFYYYIIIIDLKVEVGRAFLKICYALRVTRREKDDLY